MAAAAARQEAKSQRKAEQALAKRFELVNAAKLRPTNSYSTPDFVVRGYYVDKPFDCKHCGKPQLWSGTQQKWWYEVAKGDVWTTAVLCRSCRASERSRKAQARDVHLSGVARAMNLGPKSAEVLVRAGITSLAQIRSMGAVRAFSAAKRVEPSVTLNLLWALEGAILGEPWQRVAKEHRASLLIALEDHERHLTQGHVGTEQVTRPSIRRRDQRA